MYSEPLFSPDQPAHPFAKKDLPVSTSRTRVWRQTALAVLVCLLANSGVHAQTGTLTATGVVSAATCTLSAPTAVTLPPVGAGLLANVGDVAGSATWTVTASGCSGLGTTPIMRTFFENGAYVSSTGRLLNMTGSAANVEVEILDPLGNRVDLRQPAGSQNVTSTSLGSGSASQTFTLRYYAAGTVTPGNFGSTFVWTMLYN